MVTYANEQLLLIKYREDFLINVQAVNAHVLSIAAQQTFKTSFRFILQLLPTMFETLVMCANKGSLTKKQSLNIEFCYDLIFSSQQHTCLKYDFSSFSNSSSSGQHMRGQQGIVKHAKKSKRCCFNIYKKFQLIFQQLATMFENFVMS